MKLFVVLSVFVISAGVYAQIPSDREGLLRGEGMGLARYAEQNGFPGPKHVLEWKDTLGLTPGQVKTAEALVEGVMASARVVGQQIVAAEENLNALFAQSGSPDKRTVQSVLDEIARLRARLRYIHLDAHLQMKELLTHGQIQLYSTLRGHGTTEKK